MLKVSVLFIIAGSAIASSINNVPKTMYQLDEAEAHFEDFIVEYERKYADENEKAMRFEIFKKNLVFINNLNSKNEHGVHGITQFTDLTSEEFSQYTGVRLDNGKEQCPQTFDASALDASAPEEFDWRTQNVVSPVKNQLLCGSCWAFSSIGAIESQYLKNYGQQMTFSEQQLVDCDGKDNGCHGGWPPNAFMSLIDEGGVLSDTDYPYINQVQQCQFNPSQVRVRLSSCRSSVKIDEESLKQWLYSEGPISIVLDATTLVSYKGGIMAACEGTAPALHAALLVGYGTENGIPYWILKNSWATTWGLQGYAKIPRGVNVCGLADYSQAIPYLA